MREYILWESPVQCVAGHDAALAEAVRQAQAVGRQAMATGATERALAEAHDFRDVRENALGSRAVDGQGLCANRAGEMRRAAVVADYELRSLHRGGEEGERLPINATERAEVFRALFRDDGEIDARRL